MMTFGLNDPAFIGDVPASGGDFAFPFRGPFSASDYFNADSISVTGNYPRSMACWAKPAAVGANMYAIALSRRDRTYDIYGVEFGADGFIRGKVIKSGSSAITAGHPFSAGQWYHVGLVVSSSELKLYVGGTHIDTVAHSLPAITTWRLSVGSRSGGSVGNFSADPFDGLVADACWWGTRDTSALEFAAMAAGEAANVARTDVLEHLTLSKPLVSATSGSWIEVGNVP